VRITNTILGAAVAGGRQEGKEDIRILRCGGAGDYFIYLADWSAIFLIEPRSGGLLQCSHTYPLGSFFAMDNTIKCKIFQRMLHISWRCFNLIHQSNYSVVQQFQHLFLPSSKKTFHIVAFPSCQKSIGLRLVKAPRIMLFLNLTAGQNFWQASGICFYAPSCAPHAPRLYTHPRVPWR
jgi:hypothetical protein